MLYINAACKWLLHMHMFPANGQITWKLAQVTYTAQKMKFSIQDFFSKCDQIRCEIWKMSFPVFLYLAKYY